MRAMNQVGVWGVTQKHIVLYKNALKKNASVHSALNPADPSCIDIAQISGTSVLAFDIKPLHVKVKTILTGILEAHLEFPITDSIS